MSVSGVWPKSLDIFGTLLIIEVLPGQVPSIAGLLWRMLCHGAGSLAATTT
jgi:hypothetical protein